MGWINSGLTYRTCLLIRVIELGIELGHRAAPTKRQIGWLPGC